MAQQPLPADSQTQSPAGYSRHDQTPATVQELVARKVCRICHEVKSLADYHRNKVNADGHNSMCKTCAAEYDKEKRRRRQRVHEPTLTEKECPHCKKVKPAEGFYRYSLSQDGLYNICKLCHADQAKARQEAKAGMCPPPEKVSLHCLCYHTCYVLHCSHRQPFDLIVSQKSTETHSVSVVCNGWICVCNQSACYYVTFPCTQTYNAQSKSGSTNTVSLYSVGSSHLFRASLQLHAAVPVQMCSSCRLTKPSTEFYTNKTAADMLHSLCKTCHGDKCRSRASGNYEVSVVDKVHQFAL